MKITFAYWQDWTVWHGCFLRSKMVINWHFHITQLNSANNLSNKDPNSEEKYSKLFFFLVLIFKTKKQIMAKPGFIKKLRQLPNCMWDQNMNPPSLLHVVSILAVNRENCSKQDPVYVLLSPCLSATSLCGESGPSHSGNLFNSKNSDQISFRLATVEHSFKLNKIFFLLAFYWIGSLLSFLLNLYDCKCILIPWQAHPLLCWEQNRTWQTEITACLSLCEITNVT